jgi:tetratricopeptide (TPR) repeat protein
MEQKMKQSRNLKPLMILAVVLISASSVQAQSLTKDEKQVKKCWKVFHKKGQDKGIEKLEKYMASQSWSSLLAYESLVAMEYERYSSGTNMFSGMTLTVEGGTEEESDSLTQAFQEMLLGLYENRLINVCRRGTMESTSYTADVYLRQFLVDYNPDTLVSEKAQSYYDEGEEYFGKEDYEMAAMNYRKAFNEDTTYFKAMLYLGDSFWASEQYDSALVYFSKARDMQPNLLEPRVYIVDALIEQGLFYRAKKECLDAMLVYPGHNLKYKLLRVLEVENKYLNERRVLRNFFPNDMGNEDQYMLETSFLWGDYRAAKDDVSKYCNEDGIIEENGEFEDRYLEVYSFRKMLEAHPNDLPEHLHFADKMREEGYLDSYVFISLFHVDIYPQFKDFMSHEENRVKTLGFIEKYLIEPV